MRVQVVCAWLEEGIQSPDIRALFAPLFFLARGRVAEALHAHARLQRLPPTAGAQQSQKNSNACGHEQGRCQMHGMWSCSRNLQAKRLGGKLQRGPGGGHKMFKSVKAH